MPAYSHFDYYLRTIVTAVLSLGIVGVAAYAQLTGSSVGGPFKDWAGIIVGVYFGSHVAMNGSGARRRQNEAEQTAAVPIEVVPQVVTATPDPPTGPVA